MLGRRQIQTGPKARARVGGNPERKNAEPKRCCGSAAAGGGGSKSLDRSNVQTGPKARAIVR